MGQLDRLMRAAWVLALAGCVTCEPVHVPKPYPTCADVCGRWRQLGCSLAEPTRGGQSCEAVCGPAVHWDRECLAAVESCDAILECQLRR